jgi:hypothetical protein
MTDTIATRSDLLVIFDNILALDVSECAVAVCLASWPKEADLPVFQRLQMAERLADAFREVVGHALAPYRNDRTSGDLVLRQYDAGSKPDADEIEHLDLAADQTLRQPIALLAPLIGTPVFEADASFVAGLRFYVIVAQPRDGDPVYFFRAYTPRKELSRSRGLFAALFHEGQYDTVRAPLFLFDQQIDCISQGEHLYVLNKTNLQAMFRFFERLQKVARATLETIRARVPIHNFDTFARDCEGHPVKLAKLKNIAGKPYLARLTVGDIRRVVERYHLPIQFASAPDGQETIVYDPADRWTLLKLLDDDYLWSSLTSEAYEVSGKRPLP